MLDDLSGEVEEGRGEGEREEQRGMAELDDEEEEEGRLDAVK